MRFGGLSSVKQKGYDPAMPGTHSPPCTRGIYAFPLGNIIPFLLGGDLPSAKGSARYVKDKDGNRVPYEGNEDFYKNFEIKPYVYASGAQFEQDKNFYKVFSTRKASDGESYWTKPAPMKRFDYAGEIWHHLGHNLKPHQILKRKGSWVLSNIRDYAIAIKKESVKLRSESISAFANVGGTRMPLQEINKKFGCYNTDHLEVFIEKV